MPTYTCSHCKLPFSKEGRLASFCSALCRTRSHREKNRTEADFCRTLACATCSKPFSQVHKTQRYCSLDCRAVCHTRLREARQTAEIMRIYYDPQPGDLVESDGCFRWIVRRGVEKRKHAIHGEDKRVSDCVTFRNLPFNEELTMKIAEWKNWCKDRNGSEKTRVRHVLTRKEKGL